MSMASFFPAMLQNIQVGRKTPIEETVETSFGKLSKTEDNCG